MSLRYRYQTLEFEDFDIHLRTLRDNQEFEDPQGVAAALGISSAQWSLFGVVWDASRVLAEVMSHREVAGLRILEVGCGIGLASLVLNERDADITATDMHPKAGAFLARNVALNDGSPIPFVRTGWLDDETNLGQFDLIIGSDLLYEDGHAEALAGFVDQHAAPRCTVVLVDPGRGRHARFSKRMVSLGYAHSQREAEGEETLDGDFSGQIITFAREPDTATETSAA